MQPTEPERLRIAAAGDIHCRRANTDRIAAAIAAMDAAADLILLAGDLTSHGTAEEAEILSAAVEGVETPVFAVLGNHDWHAGQSDEIAARLRESGITVLEREAKVCEIADIEVGVAGIKGYAGGFAPHHLPDFGEGSLRGVYAETADEVQGLDAALHEIATCRVRIALLHYSPVAETLDGEPPEIFAFLGSDRLAAPILEHGPDLVLHGHAHAGSPEGSIGETPVYNVSQPVLGRDFRLIELQPGSSPSPIP